MSGNRHADFDPSCRPYELAPSFLGCSLGASGRNPNNLSDCRFRKGPETGLQLIPAKVMCRPVGTGTQRETLLSVPPEVLKYPSTLLRHPCPHSYSLPEVKAVTRDKEGHYIVIKVWIHQKDITIKNIHAPNIGAHKYLKQILRELKEN